MKKLVLSVAILATLGLSACSAAATPTPIPTLVLDAGESTRTSNAGAISAAAIVVPTKYARLSFSSVGRVTEVHVKPGDRVSAGELLVELDTAILEAKVREAEANVEAAAVQVRYLKRVGTDQVHLESAEADVARAQALLDSANATLLAHSSLAAPFGGTIVSVDIAPAETVVPGQVVIILGDLSRYNIETTDLSERDVPQVSIGEMAVVYIEALDAEYPGTVKDIERISSSLGADVVYTVTVELHAQPPGLLWGMSADVDFQAEQ